MLKYYQVGSAAVEYMRERLSEGHALAHQIMSLPFESGSVTALLPPDTPEGALLSFRTGGLVRRSDAVDHIAAMVQTFLKGSVGRCGILEDAVRRRGDPALSGLATKYGLCGAQVYHILPESADTQSIAKSIKAGSSHLFVGVLAQDANLQSIQPGSEINEALLADIVRKSNYVMIGAYDEETILMWRRKGVDLLVHTQAES